MARNFEPNIQYIGIYNIYADILILIAQRLEFLSTIIRGKRCTFYTISLCYIDHYLCLINNFPSHSFHNYFVHYYGHNPILTKIYRSISIHNTSDRCQTLSQVCLTIKCPIPDFALAPRGNSLDHYKKLLTRVKSANIAGMS